METKPSDAGYPEEQPDQVHDDTTDPDEPRKDKDDREKKPDHGKSTGNPKN